MEQRERRRRGEWVGTVVAAVQPQLSSGLLGRAAPHRTHAQMQGTTEWEELIQLIRAERESDELVFAPIDADVVYSDDSEDGEGDDVREQPLPEQQHRDGRVVQEIEFQFSEGAKTFVELKKKELNGDRSVAAEVGRKVSVSLNVKQQAVDYMARKITIDNIRLYVADNSKPRVFVQSMAQVSSWKKALSTQANIGKKRTRADGGGRHVLHGEVEQKLLAWFQKARGDGVVVSRAMFEDVVTKESEKLEKPRPGKRWLESFRHRHRIVRRAIQRRTLLTNEEIMNRLQRFIAGILSLGGADFVINVDEIPVSLAGTMCSQHHTYNFVGGHNILGRFEANYTKRAATHFAALAVDTTAALQIVIPPLIIHKTDMKSHPVSHNHGCVNINNLCGVTNGNVMISHVLPWLSSRVPRGKSVLLILDSARCHTTPAVISRIREMQWNCRVVPPGLTMFCQSIDTCYASRLKHNHYATFLEERLYEKKMPRRCHGAAHHSGEASRCCTFEDRSRTGRPNRIPTLGLHHSYS